MFGICNLFVAVYLLKGLKATVNMNRAGTGFGTKRDSLAHFDVGFKYTINHCYNSAINLSKKRR